jgi:hypothetical protein
MTLTIDRLNCSDADDPATRPLPPQVPHLHPPPGPCQLYRQMVNICSLGSRKQGKRYRIGEREIDRVGWW